MSDEHKARFNEGMSPIVGSTPPAPDWDSLQFDTMPDRRRLGPWWAAPAMATTLILVLGVGSFFLVRSNGDADDAASEDPTETTEAGEPASIEGRWILESWEEGGEMIPVEIGVNTTDEAWLEFTAAGTFSGYTGCNRIGEGSYDYTAGLLTLGGAHVNAAGCDPADVERVMVATLANTPDGIEVIMGTDRMEWYGSNVEGISYPLVFRRDGAAPSPSPSEDEPTTSQVTMHVHDVDGVEVVTLSRLPDLPDVASIVEFTGMVIDSGKGPELCFGGVQESLPPQCGGPVAFGLEMVAWAEQQNGVQWGERSVVVTWPPVDEVVEVVSDGEPVPIDAVFPPGELPSVCEGIDLGAGAGPVNEYAASLGDVNGGLYLANDGTLVLQVVGDPEPHRQALAEAGGACVIEVLRSEAEQRRIQDSLADLLRAIPELGGFSLSTGPGGRIDIGVAVADRATALAIAELVDDPQSIRIVGTAIIHDSE